MSKTIIDNDFKLDRLRKLIIDSQKTKTNFFGNCRNKQRRKI